MKPKLAFVIHSAIAGGYAIAFLAAAGPLLAVYGIAPDRGAVYMARWFGIGLLATGLSTWFARDAADSHAGHALSRALAVSYGVGIGLAAWGVYSGTFNHLGWLAVGFNTLLCAAFSYLLLTDQRPAIAKVSTAH